jgi:hypothetical protein
MWFRCLTSQMQKGWILSFLSVFVNPHVIHVVQVFDITDTERVGLVLFLSVFVKSHVVHVVQVFDITDADSFERVKGWVKELRVMVGLPFSYICRCIAEGRKYY